MQTENNQTEVVEIAEDSCRCFRCEEVGKTIDMLSVAITNENDYTKNTMELVCEYCYRQRCFKCLYCEHRFSSKHVECTDIGDNWSTEYVCDNCCNNFYIMCERCDRWVQSEDACDGMCDICNSERDEDEEDSLMRGCDTLTEKHLSTQTGDIVKSKRIFSAEVECYYKNTSDLKNVADNISEFIGISGDGSLNNGRGIEFQTPRLSGIEGEKTIRSLCTACTNNNMWVDHTCGLHIHIDGGKVTTKLEKDNKKEPVKLKNLMLFYLHYEDVILSFLPPSRRDNRYCIPLSYNYDAMSIIQCKTLEELEQVWYKQPRKENLPSEKDHHYNGTRYSGINFHSLLSQNHIEIRFHSGTLDYNKILYWIDLHTRIFDYCMKKGFTLKTLDDRNFNTISDKANTFSRVLGLSSESKDYFRKRQEKFNIQKLTKLADSQEELPVDNNKEL